MYSHAYEHNNKNEMVLEICDLRVMRFQNRETKKTRKTFTLRAFTSRITTDWMEESMRDACSCILQLHIVEWISCCCCSVSPVAIVCCLFCQAIQIWCAAMRCDASYTFFSIAAAAVAAIVAVDFDIVVFHYCKLLSHVPVAAFPFSHLFLFKCKLLFAKPFFIACITYGRVFVSNKHYVWVSCIRNGISLENFNFKPISLCPPHCHITMVPFAYIIIKRYNYEWCECVIK